MEINDNKFLGGSFLLGYCSSLVIGIYGFPLQEPLYRRINTREERTEEGRKRED